MNTIKFNHKPKEKKQRVSENINSTILNIIKKQISEVDKLLNHINDIEEVKNLITYLKKYIENIKNHAQLNEGSIFHIFSTINTIIIICDQRFDEDENKNDKTRSISNNSFRANGPSNFMCWQTWSSVKKKLSNIGATILTLVIPKSWSISGQLGVNLHWLASSQATIQVNFGK